MTPAGPQFWTPYCGAAPLPAELLSRWNPDPALLAVLAVGALGLWRLAGPDAVNKRLSVTIAFLLGLFLFVSPFCALTSALFSARVVHHVLLTAVMAPLLAFSISGSRVPRVGSPAAWTLIQALALWMWHAPQAYAEALASDALFWLMQLSLLGTSTAFWLALRSALPTTAVGALLATMVQMGLLGALITFAGQPLYAPHLASTMPWGLSALEDQQLAGLVMWAPSAGIYLAAALSIAARSLKAERRLAA